MKILALVVLLMMPLLGCPTTGGPGWSPEDCTQDIELAEMIGRRINRAIRQSGRDAVSQADWDRYAAVGKLLAAAGCRWVPEDWASAEERGAT